MRTKLLSQFGIKVGTFVWHNWVVLGFFGFWICYFIAFWSRALYFDELGNLVAGHINIWGDWAVHFTMGSSMAYRQLILTESPLLLGAPFGYPFFANLLSAVLIRLSVPFVAAFVIPSFLFSVLLIFGLFCLYRVIFKSKNIAVLASVIFLLNGGFGFTRYVEQILEAPNVTDAILNPQEKYTHNEEQNIRWISVIDSMVIPQRAFNHGFPVALIALVLLYSVLNQKDGFNKKRIQIWTGGLLVAILPIFHTHSFIAVGLLLLCWFFVYVVLPKKTVSFFNTAGLPIVIALLIAVPLLLQMTKNTGSFVSTQLGWYGADDSSWINFWLKNWGVTPILALAGWLVLFRKSTNQQRWVSIGTFVPFFIIFILANIFLFQPYAWDNTKLFVWSAVGFSGLAAYFLKQLASYPRFVIGAYTVASILFITTIFSGFIDMYQIQQIERHNYIMYSNEELQLADWVKTNTDVNAVWLTGDNHNHWLYNLTGRQPLLTFRAWLWTHGYSYSAIEHDVLQLYSNPQAAQSIIGRYDIQYAVIGPNELSTWNADASAFNKLFPAVYRTSEYTIYDLQPKYRHVQ